VSYELETSDLSSLQNVPTCFRAHQASLAVKYRNSFPLSVKWSGDEVTTHFHLALMLRMSGAVLPLPLYVYVVWTGTSFIHRQLLIFLKSVDPACCSSAMLCLQYE